MKQYMKYIMILLTCLIVSGCSKKEEYSKNMFYMDTYINVKIFTNNGKKAKEALDKADKIYNKYQNLSNACDENSTLYKLNHNQSNEEYIEVDKDLYKLLKLGDQWYKKSNGLFNINMGNLLSVWKDNPKELPNVDDITIYPFEIKDGLIKNENLYLDLGAITKGYATEEVGNYLESIGFDYYLINAGGNIKVGKNNTRGYYNIGVENPEKKGINYTVISGNDISVVTSGGYERFYEINGKKYHHIIDPNTKYPANNSLSTTVVTKNSSLADILSTTLFLMEPTDAIKFVNKIDDVEAVIYVNEDKILKSKGFNKYEQK